MMLCLLSVMEASVIRIGGLVICGLTEALDELYFFFFWLIGWFGLFKHMLRWTPVRMRFFFGSIAQMSPLTAIYKLIVQAYILART